MPEGGDIAALANALDEWTRGKELTVCVGDERRRSLSGGVSSVGKQFRLELAEEVFSGHLGLSGSVLVRTSLLESAAGQQEFGAWTELVSHKGVKGSMVAWIEWEETDRVVQIGFRSGTASRFVLEPKTRDSDAMDLVRTDLESLVERWLRVCAQSPKRSIESLLTDQNQIAGAGKKLRFKAFEGAGLSGKEKSGSLSLAVRRDVLVRLKQAATAEHDERAQLLHWAYEKFSGHLIN
jgi:formamidopyrimidine-DNA glycosylase